MATDLFGPCSTVRYYPSTFPHAFAKAMDNMTRAFTPAASQVRHQAFRIIGIWLGLAGLLLLVGLLPVHTALAGPGGIVTVTTTVVTNNAGDGQCDLHEAL